MLELVRPDARYQRSFLEALQEFVGEEWNHHAHDDLAATNFATFLARLDQEARGENLPAGKVPQQFIWLVDGDRYLGRVSIRGRLNENLRRVGGHIGYAIRPSDRGKGYGKRILELALEQAKQLGLTRVLLTCNETSIASRKIIEHCGGVLQDAIVVRAGEPRKRRYWIVLTT